MESHFWKKQSHHFSWVTQWNSSLFSVISLFLERESICLTLSLSSFVCTCDSHVGFDAVMDGEYLWLQRIEWAKVKKLSSLFWIITLSLVFLGRKYPVFKVKYKTCSWDRKVFGSEGIVFKRSGVVLSGFSVSPYNSQLLQASRCFFYSTIFLFWLLSSILSFS